MLIYKLVVSPRRFLDVIATIPTIPMPSPSNVISTGKPGMKGIGEVGGVDDVAVYVHSIIGTSCEL